MADIRPAAWPEGINIDFVKKNIQNDFVEAIGEYIAECYAQGVSEQEIGTFVTILTETAQELYRKQWDPDVAQSIMEQAIENFEKGKNITAKTARKNLRKRIDALVTILSYEPQEREVERIAAVPDLLPQVRAILATIPLDGPLKGSWVQRFGMPAIEGDVDLALAQGKSDVRGVVRKLLRLEDLIEVGLSTVPEGDPLRTVVDQKLSELRTLLGQAQKKGS